ncbi:UbiA prenyltransferase family [Xylariaceae sp. FL1019]|nr:UbiA prenyltransferase family [Xylariaceae sp. FL1019]
MRVQALSRSLCQIKSFLDISWGFVESDMFTFAIPNTAFGILSAFASTMLVDNEASPTGTSLATIISRLPYVLAFNIANLFIFDLANQRAPQSVAEDRINKPWRPIPQGKITMEQTRRLMLGTIPLVSLLNYLVGAWQQGVFIIVLSWMYNDLGGGDEAFVREIIIAVAYGLFNSGSLFVATGSGSPLSLLGLIWTAIVSGVILTTMQIQDLKDQKGDKLRNRKTIVLHLGETFSRVSVAFFVCFWSLICRQFWTSGPFVTVFTTLIALVVAVRVLVLRSQSSDARTWRLWCLWHASLYTLPVFFMQAS